MNRSEEEMLRRARVFDPDALSFIYDEYSPGIYRYAYRLLGDEHLSEECVADTFDKFLKALKQGGGPNDQLKAYLYRVAHNWITDTYRRGGLPPLELKEEMIKDDPFDADPLAQRQVRLALARLTPEQRQVVVLRFVEGWENESIARLMNKTVQAVKALQHRGLLALRGLLLEEEVQE